MSGHATCQVTGQGGVDRQAVGTAIGQGPENVDGQGEGTVLGHGVDDGLGEGTDRGQGAETADGQVVGRVDDLVMGRMGGVQEGGPVEDGHSYGGSRPTKRIQEIPKS